MLAFILIVADVSNRAVDENQLLIICKKILLSATYILHLFPCYAYHNTLTLMNAD